MKRILGNAEYVLKHPNHTALMVAILYGGFTNEEIEEISRFAKYLVWKRKRCNNGKDNH